MKSRYIYISNTNRCISLQKKYKIPTQNLRPNENIFIVSQTTTSQNIEIEALEKRFFPFFKIIKKDKDYTIVRVIPEQSLLGSVQMIHSEDAEIEIFTKDMVKFFTDTDKKCWKFRQSNLDFSKKPLIMGILNVTPDSFSDGGKYIEKQRAIEHALQMIEEGADLIDIGGESTRPGAEVVDAEEELRRVIPVIEGIRNHSDRIISIDTYKSIVANDAIDAGAQIINDISGTVFDEKMLSVIEEKKCPVIIMHIKGTPKDMQINPVYSDLHDEVYEFFKKKCQEIERLNDGQIIIDPGIGFGKSLSHNLHLLRDIRDFTFLNKPILVGGSRKSFIGNVLNLEQSERLVGSLASEIYSFLNGADILRVHDVRETVEATTIINNILEC
jgi:dihydropteroate synthase